MSSLVPAIPPARRPTQPAVLLALALCLCATGCGPWRAAYGSVAGAMESVKATNRSLHAVGGDAYSGCIKHGAGTAEYAACAKPWIEHLERYVDYGQPGGRTAVEAGFFATRTAEALGKKPPDLAAVMKAGGCAFVRTMATWKGKLKDAGLGGLSAFKFLDPADCVEAKKLSGGAILGLTVAAVELLKGLVSIFGSPVDELRKSIEAWLRAPPDPAARELLAKFKAALPK